MILSTIIISESGAGAGAGRAKGGKGMGMGKGHKARRREQEAAEASQSNILQIDPDASFRTHILFPGRREDAPDTNSTAKPTFFNMLTSGKIFSSKESGLPFGGNVSVPPTEIERYRNEDPFTKERKVTFDGDGRYPSMEKQLRPPPDLRPNSYHCEPRTKGGSAERPPFTSLQEPYR